MTYFVSMEITTMIFHKKTTMMTLLNQYRRDTFQFQGFPSLPPTFPLVFGSAVPWTMVYHKKVMIDQRVMALVLFQWSVVVLTYRRLWRLTMIVVDDGCWWSTVVIDGYLGLVFSWSQSDRMFDDVLMSETMVWSPSSLQASWHGWSVDDPPA